MYPFLPCNNSRDCELLQQKKNVMCRLLLYVKKAVQGAHILARSSSNGPSKGAGKQAPLPPLLGLHSPL